MIFFCTPPKIFLNFFLFIFYCSSYSGEEQNISHLITWINVFFVVKIWKIYGFQEAVKGSLINDQSNFKGRRGSDAVWNFHTREKKIMWKFFDRRGGEWTNDLSQIVKKLKKLQIILCMKTYSIHKIRICYCLLIDDENIRNNKKMYVNRKLEEVTHSQFYYVISTLTQWLNITYSKWHILHNDLTTNKQWTTK